MKQGQRIGKLGLKILQDGLYESMFPLVYCQYYSLIGCLFEPLQAVIDMHRQTIDLSLKVGNSSMAALNKAFLFTLKLRSGTNLCQLKEEFEREMNVQHHPGSSTYLQVLLRELYEGVCALIGNETSGLCQKVDDGSDAVFDNEQSPHNLSRMMYCCYLGFHERTMHLAKRWEVFSNSLSPHQMPRNLNHSRTIYSCFYYGLSYIGMRRKRNFKQNLLSENDTASWLNVVNCAARCSKYNFENKRALLMAEKLSYLLNNDEAEAMYDIAIKASKSSHFIQEEVRSVICCYFVIATLANTKTSYCCVQALSYELAGAHYERLEKFTKALELYKQAECCYEIWGSVVKTCQMKEKIKEIGLNKNTKKS
jgi:tetratricopeptide (TPR) repeat protein